MRFSAALAVILCFAMTDAIADECENPRTQLEMNLCSDIQFAEADKQLNLVWSQIQKTYSKSDYDQQRKAKLLASQRTWLTYRDAECVEAIGFDWEGGTGRPMAVNQCAAALTKLRTLRLKERLLPSH